MTKKEDKKNAAARIDDLVSIDIPAAEQAYEAARLALNVLREEAEELLRFIRTP